jgi:predicted TIM-barrel fold metal-dependent hydrolase
MRKVSIVSTDGHAVLPTELWPEYLERRFHEYLPALRADDEINRRSMYPLNDAMMVPALDLFDTDGVYRAEGWKGAWDADVRLAELDREGVAAELVYHGFFRVADLGFSVMNATYPDDLVDAGARAHNRWVFDTFGALADRFLLVGAIGTGRDLDGTIAEIDWIADHGFVGSYAPGFVGMAGAPPLDDEYWDRFWARCAERDVAMIVHGGYGLAQGYAFDQIAATCEQVDAEGGTEIDLVTSLAQGIFSERFFADLQHRRAMWQLMLGGVFDRHPRLKLMMAEVRADWLPETLAHLDTVYDVHRADLASRRKPSDWWESNCLAGVSFMHKAEIEIRDDIGVTPKARGRTPSTTCATCSRACRRPMCARSSGRTPSGSSVSTPRRSPRSRRRLARRSSSCPVTHPTSTRCSSPTSTPAPATSSRRNEARDSASSTNSCTTTWHATRRARGDERRPRAGG